MALHAYVDESDRGTYMVCSAFVDPSDADALRAVLRGLRRRGAARIHMAKESMAHRKLILSVLTKQPVTATVYVSHYPVYREGRAEIMRRIVEDPRANRLAIESAVGQDDHDRAVLYEAVRKAGRETLFNYIHLTAKVEPLLWLPDVIVWAWGAGRDWRRRVRPVVSETVIVRR